jgi:hypothetical protein
MQTVVTTKLIDRYPFKRGPYDGIPAGERGTVIDIDEDTGHILVELEKYFRSLEPWHNCIWFSPECRSEIRPVD